MTCCLSIIDMPHHIVFVYKILMRISGIILKNARMRENVGVKSLLYDELYEQRQSQAYVNWLKHNQ